MISVLGVLVVFAGLAVTAVTYSQATFVDDQGCKWVPVENPETGEPFSSEGKFEGYLQEQGKQMPDIQLQVRDGVLHQKLTCVNTGGENLR